MARLTSESRALLAVARPLALGGTYRAALEAFGVAVAAGGAASPDIEDGFRSLAVVVAAEESAQTGRSTAVPPA
jgi:predicted dehydrogenase